MARRASDLNWGIQREKRNADSAGNDTAAARTGTWVEFQEFDFMGYSDRLLAPAVESAARHPGLNPMIRFGMRLFLASLSVLFIAGVVGYLIIRGQGHIPAPAEGVSLPRGLWISTAILLISGWTIHLANGNARSGDAARLKRHLGMTFVLSVLFVGVQAPSLAALLGTHRAALADHSFSLYGISFALIGIHAAHVLGGMVPLGWIFALAWRGGIGSHLQPAVNLCAIYWHFLDVVWVLLYCLLLLTL